VERGLNLEELAQETGISKSALGSCENDDDGNKEINHGSLLKLADAEIYVDGMATMRFRDMNSSLAAVRAMILEDHPEAVADRAIKVLEAGQIEEEDFFCHVTHKTWDVILHDIRKAHENDSESAPDTTPADELIREVQKVMQSPGDRVQQFTEMFCKAFQLKYKRLSQEERSLLKKLFKKSPLIKQSGINFRRKSWK
jgi:transcriptional regulator with XRE-family HTH domain